MHPPRVRRYVADSDVPIIISQITPPPPLHPPAIPPIFTPMSLPPGFIDELRDRSSIAQVVGRKLSWDSRKSNPGKGDYWAPCPFHAEKTASFHVDDQKGFYYCFGCHAKGNVYSFIQETENVNFMEAVEILAREAGMPMPARDPRAQEKADQRTILTDIMEQAVQFYRLQLRTNTAQSARDYLEKRGLPAATLEQFQIGYAGNNRNGLFQHLTDKGVKADDIVLAGLAIKPDDGGNPFDRFRNRIMFPIRDARGRCTAFGGRAMDANQPAKYLNSPETPLFDKGRSLYNHQPAREAAGKVQSLIVAEGYMDVIALSQAGFKHSVAPLGTAITADQLQLMWRITSEPIIALDGDKAGLRAAMRLIDIALPLLEAGKSLRFCIMPEGQDPDDLIKTSGAKAMQALLDTAQPMVKLLWQRETEGKIFDSPERRAALDADLRTALNTIQDRSIKAHYGQIIKDYRYELFTKARPQQAWGGKDWRKKPPQKATDGLKSSLLAQGAQADVRLREAVILLAAILHPKAALDNETALEKCRINTVDFKEIHNALLANLHEDLSDNDAAQNLAQKMADRLGYNPIDRLTELKSVRTHPYLHSGADKTQIKRTLIEELTKHAAILGALHEMLEAEEELGGMADESTTWRIQQATEARNKATKTDFGNEDNSNDDSENLSQGLQKMLDDQIWVKKKP
jgi:DNA primase